MSTTNPATMLPGMNPSGSNVVLSPWAASGGGVSSGNPYAPIQVSGVGSGVPGASPYNSTSPTSPLSMPSTSASSSLLPFQSAGAPGATGSPVPAGGAAPGAPTATPSNSNSGNVPPGPAGAALGVPTTSGGQSKLLQTLNKAYGAGLGTTLFNFLSSGAGFNQTAINNLIAALQPGFEQDQQNLLGAFSAGGNRFSSGAEIGEATLMGQEQLNVGQLETQMYEQSVNDYMSVLLGASSGSNARKLQAGAATSSLIGNIINNLMSNAKTAATAEANG